MENQRTFCKHQQKLSKTNETGTETAPAPAPISLILPATALQMRHEQPKGPELGIAVLKSVSYDLELT